MTINHGKFFAILNLKYYRKVNRYHIKLWIQRPLSYHVKPVSKTIKNL